MATRRLAKPRPVQGKQVPPSGGPPRDRVAAQRDGHRKQNPAYRPANEKPAHRAGFSTAALLPLRKPPPPPRRRRTFRFRAEPAALAACARDDDERPDRGDHPTGAKSSAAPADVVLLALYEQRIYTARCTGDRRSRRARRSTVLPNELRRRSADRFPDGRTRELYRLTPPIGVHADQSRSARPARRAARATTAMRSAGSAFRGTSSQPSTSSRRSSESCAARVRPALRDRCSSCRRRGGAMGSAETCTTRTTRSSVRRTTSTLQVHHRDLRHALHHYNPSSSYVDAGASLCATDRRRPHAMFYALLQLAGLRQDSGR